MGVPFEKLKAMVESLHEFNPMMGHSRLPSGCSPIRKSLRCRPRQLSAAAINVMEGQTTCASLRRSWFRWFPRSTSCSFVKKVIKAKADELIEASGLKMKYMVGTMIETPRAAVTSDEIAEEAEFFSFGTNDLTQMTYGFSRDDAGRILEHLLREEDLRV